MIFHTLIFSPQIYNVHLLIIQTTPLHGGRLLASKEASSFLSSADRCLVAWWRRADHLYTRRREGGERRWGHGATTWKFKRPRRLVVLTRLTICFLAQEALASLRHNDPLVYNYNLRTSSGRRRWFSRFARNAAKLYSSPSASRNGTA